MDKRYGLGFQPGDKFKLHPDAKEVWLAYSAKATGTTYALPADSSIAIRLMKDMEERMVEDQAFHARASAASTAFWPNKLADAVITR
jgi:hypothetical protein